MKKPNSKTKSAATLSPSEAANQALAPAIAYAAPGGRHSMIADIMTRLTGQPVNRQMVGRWLNPDPERREQPRLGYGIMLLWAVELCRRAEANGATPETIGAHSTIEVSVELSRPAIGDKNVRVGILTGSAKADATPAAVRSSRRVATLKNAIKLTGAQAIKENTPPSRKRKPVLKPYPVPFPKPNPPKQPPVGKAFDRAVKKARARK